MTLVKLYELIRHMVNPFYYAFDHRNYKVVCNGETVTGIQIDDEKGQVILKTYKKKKVSKTEASTAWDPGRPLTVDEAHYYYK